jgi:hypothetical protein
MAGTVVRVRPAERADAAAWLELRHALWPEGSVEEHASEIERFFSGQAREPLAVLIAENPAGRPLGFAELPFRPTPRPRDRPRRLLEGWCGAGVAASGWRASRRRVGGWARTWLHQFASDRSGQRSEHRRPQGTRVADAGRLQC